MNDILADNGIVYIRQRGDSFEVFDSMTNEKLASASDFRDAQRLARNLAEAKMAFTLPGVLPATCCCGAATVGAWTAGNHHGAHRCARVLTRLP
jgi:hypothetical protein